MEEDLSKIYEAMKTWPLFFRIDNISYNEILYFKEDLNMRKVKNADPDLKKKVVKLVIFMVSELIEVSFTVFGIAYLFMVGGLFVKSLAIAVGSLIILGGISSIADSFRLARSIARIQKIWNELDKTLEIDLNKDK